ncbi:molybdenum cofactor guanylyltransferase [Sandaracinobacteroides saxicola]|uniref:Molybdenum cofactor guanylyltransferase n=1 Tax=Sandaracinobacteroides saxicola TaxID=2759707 RepID=A0A7G5IKW7_9SPHN|nr:molybdenum cofactor guanylyltransferase [Sandaracinobacteroides saxicola]QMW24009.1 molybdenum cofactor guanylyltransferase [Sandaracinobacteroides saxicola]
MRILGAIFAGGQSSRFGSDKAVALLDGKPLLQHVVDALAPQVAVVGVVGRGWPDCTRIEDWPEPGLGPLGALCGALRFAAAHGFDAVLSAGCDQPDLPPTLAALLRPGPAVIANHWLVGLWPSSLASLAEQQLSRDQRAMRRWAAVCGARPVAAAIGRNINDYDQVTHPH